MAGDWSIASNKLSISTAQSVAVAVPESTDSPIAYRVAADASADELGEARIIVDYVDSDNYAFAEVLFTDTPGAAALKLFRRVAGVETLQASKAFAEAEAEAEIRFAVCVTPEGIVAEAGETDGVPIVQVADVGYAASSNKVGLGIDAAGHSGTITFDRFRYDRHYESSTVCIQCSLACVCGNIEGTTFRLDLGGANWTNLVNCVFYPDCWPLCDMCGCEAIGGEYDLPYLTKDRLTNYDCEWRKIDCEVCTIDENVPVYGRLQLNLVIHKSYGSPAGRRFVLFVYYGGGTAACAMACGYKYVIYQSAIISGDCIDSLADEDGKIELTKVSETVVFGATPTQTVCDGSLDNTVYIWMP